MSQNTIHIANLVSMDPIIFTWDLCLVPFVIVL